MRTLEAVVLASLPVLVACGSDGGGDQTDSASAICELSVRSYAMEAARCGGDYNMSYMLASQFAKCPTVKKVRDVHGFYAICLPYMDKQSCADFVAGKDDPTCDMQFSY